MRYRTLRFWLSRGIWAFLSVLGLSILGGETGPDRSAARDEVVGVALSSSGVPFFPVGLYYAPVGRYGELRRMGFNVVHMWALPDGSTRRALNEAQRHGLKAVVELADVWRTETPDLAKLREYVTAYRDHEALLAWYLIDEPPPDLRMVWNVRRAYRLLKELDPRHPVYVVILPRRDAAFTGALDILGTDPYPVPDHPLSLVSEYTREAGRVVQFKKPVWTVVQAHAKPLDRGQSRFPTRAEFRNMVYQSLIFGATGVLYFSYEWEGTIDLKNPDLWAYMAVINQELHRLAPILLHGRDMADAIQSKPAGQILTRVKEVSGRLHLFVVNLVNESVRADFSVQGKRLGQVQVLFEGRGIPTNQDSFTDLLPPYAARVYVL